MSELCPECGIRYHSLKAPGGACIATWDGPVMMNPCTCVVDQADLGRVVA